MPFIRIENALNICKTHIDSLDQSNTATFEIEAHIVSSLVVLIVSEYEVLIENLFAERAMLCGDDQVSQFVKSTIAKSFRSPDLNKITGTLGKFSDDYRKTFSTTILNTEYHAAWDNIMTARHAVVHKNGTLNVTFDELINSYPKTKFVIFKLREILGLGDASHSDLI